MAIPVQEEQNESIGAPAWVVSFADMSLLLLSFFVMMLATTNPEVTAEADILRILAAIKVGFGYQPNTEAPSVVDQEILELLMASRSNPAHHGTTRPMPAIEGRPFKDKDQLVKEKGMVGEAILFPHDSAEIAPGREDMLSRVVDHLRGQKKPVVVIGHCSLEEARRPDLGFSLAHRRAKAVKEVLLAAGIPSSRLRLVSVGAYEGGTSRAAPLQRRVILTLGSYYLPSGVVESGK